MSEFDYIIVGAGFSGSVIAERIVTQLNEKVLVIEQRDHVGGNCFDSFDENGVLIHNYGPHIFHTDYEEVWNYLSQFTEWIPYQHRVLAHIDGELVPLPFNLTSIEKSFPAKKNSEIKEELINAFGYEAKVPILDLQKSECPLLVELAEYVYQKVFLNYTRKQWGLKPEEIDPNVTARVPVFVSEDDRYFQDKYQGIPRNGYAQIFKKMLKNKKIDLKLNTKMDDHIQIDLENRNIFLDGRPFFGKLIYTGLVDQLFGYKFGDLPYRSLNFEKEYHQVASYQPSSVVNYPNEYEYTRITEFKKLTSQEIEGTTIFKEYPLPYGKINNLPYYPLFTDESKKIYQKYLNSARQIKNLFLVGRLAEYRYYDMDDAVKRALDVFEQIRL